MKQILICVAGATPQVITETIYALAHKDDPVLLDELYIITTSYGKKIILNKLLHEGILGKLLNEYNLPEINFNEDSMIVIKDMDGNSLDDIKNNKDNESTGDIITDFIRKMCERHDTALHCSIAGGRKTMSFYLGAALQLFGRPQDRLYHVLVSPEFENNPDFYYPPKKHKWIYYRLPDGTQKRISTRKAEIYLADLPFVRLKGRVWLEKEKFRDLISEAQESMVLSINHLPLKIISSERTIKVGNKTIKMQPMLLAFYTFFVKQKLNACKRVDKVNCHDCTACFVSMAELKGKATLVKIKENSEEIYGKGASRLYDDRWGRYEKEGGLPETIIRQYISKVNKQLQNELDNADLYIINSCGHYASTKYGIKIDKSRISKQ